MTFLYAAQKGDTLLRVARRHAMATETLANANPALPMLEPIAAGQLVRIPYQPVNRYVVQAGDSLPSIAKRFGIRLDDMTASNRGADPYKLKIGQMVILPSIALPEAVQLDLPYGYAELQADLASLLGRFPWLECRSIGRSVLGRELWALRIGCGPRAVFANAAMHANEWITAPALLSFAEQYAAALAGQRTLRGRDAVRLTEQTSLWLVPMVNPDGVELVVRGLSPYHPYFEQLLEWNEGSASFEGWKANARGVDLNDQFPAHWEIERARRDVPGPGPRDYTGEAPLTEPEAVALADFTRCVDFATVVAFHTQGREIYWNYRGYEPPVAEELAGRLAAATGYEAVKLTGSDAGYKDWFIQEFRRPGFTVELGYGVNPLPLNQLPELCGSTAEIVLELLTYAADQPR
jgi:g-D-glutamyl-meso-diaminopimelate peptidase